MSKNMAVAIAVCMSANPGTPGQIPHNVVPERRPAEKILGPDI